MKKKIIALGSVLILVFGIFIFKNFYMNDKNVKNENSGSNVVLLKKNLQTMIPKKTQIQKNLIQKNQIQMKNSL